MRLTHLNEGDHRVSEKRPAVPKSRAAVLPGCFDFHLFRYRERIIHLDA